MAISISLIIIGIALLALTFSTYLKILEEKKNIADIKDKKLQKAKQELIDVQESMSIAKAERDKMLLGLFDAYQKEVKSCGDQIKESQDLNQKIVRDAAAAYFEKLESEYLEKEETYDEEIKELEEKLKEKQLEIQELSDTLTAATKAMLRELKKKEQENFYRIPLSEEAIEDIEILNALKKRLNQKSVLSKVIWSSYFQKETTSMCNKVVGTGKVCGIYKITHIETGMCYIGQSVDISTRLKSHVKCGLGIDAPAANKLYKAMAEYGVQNFTFEVLEVCSKEDLNKNEVKWIQLYKSKEFGFNTLAGNYGK